jgi:ABC-type multidrug transport system fused ATPase/permease subunit
LVREIARQLSLVPSRVPGKTLVLRLPGGSTDEGLMEAKRQTENVPSLRQLLRLAKPYWTHLTGIFLLSLISTPISLLLAFPLKIAVDNVIGSRPLPHAFQIFVPASAMGSKPAYLMLAFGLLLSLSVIANLQALASWMLQTYTGERLVLDFRSNLFWHAQRMSLLFHAVLSRAQIQPARAQGLGRRKKARQLGHAGVA